MKLFFTGVVRQAMEQVGHSYTRWTNFNITKEKVPINTMEVGYAWNNFAHPFGSDAVGGITHVAAQQELGVLPEWRTGPGPADPAHSAAHGPDITGMYGS
jgi:hypothetical protein